MCVCVCVCVRTHGVHVPQAHHGFLPDDIYLTFTPLPTIGECNGTRYLSGCEVKSIEVDV